MKKLIISSAVAITFGIITLGMGQTTQAQQDGPVQSLRGAIGLDEINEAPPVTNLNTGKRFEKAYRQQPPMIPHKIDKYQINVKVNQCMRCHDWPYNAQEGAPKISETHYKNRSGVVLDQVARTRWFCTQCHVTQEDAPALVRNTFQNAISPR